MKLRGGIWHCDFTTPGGQRVRQSLETEDKRQAQELHDKLKAESWRVARLGGFPVVTFDEACIRWLDERASKKSLDDDKSRIGFWMKHFSGLPISSITEQKIYSAISKMTNRRHEENWRLKAEAMIHAGRKPPEFKPKPVAQATKNTHLAFIRALLRAAEREWKLLERAPHIKTPTPKNRRIRWLEPHEAQRLIDECAEPLKSIVEFALTTGLRRSNIINLEWPQIDMQRRVAWVNPEDSKNGRAIGVALNDVACQVLRRQIGRHNRYVFVYVNKSTRPDGSETECIRKMRYDANTGWRSALHRAGITNFRFHDLRHTWASWLVQAGVPLSVLQEMGGWESIEMVRRYAHLAPNHLTQHAQQIDRILRHDDTNTAQEEELKAV
ncbi:tyrosine-type recombinase/integrase [Prodigiosinella confusarubida]|uniref:tyrosine-type recombinase/integrase n=1 Tax=Serratia sp. (strain ATCC 39006) TaxID=104623 RepID=UPI003A5C74CD